MQDMDTSLPSSSMMSSQTEVSFESSAEIAHKESHDKGKVHACYVYKCSCKDPTYSCSYVQLNN